MNQGKLELVKQKIARMNINILGISKLKWTRMRELSQLSMISTKKPLDESERGE